MEATNIVTLPEVPATRDRVVVVGEHITIDSLTLTDAALATFVAMVTNFFVNNIFTYHDRRLRGWKILPGLLSFCIASSIGALANVGVAIYLFESSHTVWFLSALAGIVVGAAWNYAVTALYTWKS